MIENEEALKHQDRKFVFGMVKNIKVIFGKSVKGKKRKKIKRLQWTHHLRSNQFIQIFTLLEGVRDWQYR
jgi:hypothetical protein